MTDIVAVELRGRTNSFWDMRWTTYQPECPAVSDVIVVPRVLVKTWSGPFPSTPPAEVLADKYNPKYREQYAEYWAAIRPRTASDLYKLSHVEQGVAVYQYIETRPG